MELATFPDEHPLINEKEQDYHFFFADGKTTQIILPHIFIIFGEIQYKTPKLQFHSFNLHDTLEMHFTLGGNGMVYNNINQKNNYFIPGSQNIVHFREIEGYWEYNLKEKLKYFEVHIERQYFSETVEHCGVSSLQRFAEALNNNEFAQLAPESLPIDFAMQQCIYDIMHCRHRGGLKLLFLQSKCIELLVLQAEAFDAFSKKQKTVFALDSDKERIHFAKEYLLRNSTAPPTIPELARIAGINEFKLKRGFRELFNNTVFGSLNDYKLLQAKELILSDIPVKKVAEDSGYSSVQHFTTAFKKKFGTTQGRMKK